MFVKLSPSHSHSHWQKHKTQKSLHWTDCVLTLGHVNHSKKTDRDLFPGSQDVFRQNLKHFFSLLFSMNLTTGLFVQFIHHKQSMHLLHSSYWAMYALMEWACVCSGAIDSKTYYEFQLFLLFSPICLYFFSCLISVITPQDVFFFFQEKMFSTCVQSCTAAPTL